MPWHATCRPNAHAQSSQCPVYLQSTKMFQRHKRMWLVLVSRLNIFLKLSAGKKKNCRNTLAICCFLSCVPSQLQNFQWILSNSVPGTTTAKQNPRTSKLIKWIPMIWTWLHDLHDSCKKRRFTAFVASGFFSSTGSAGDAVAPAFIEAAWKITETIYEAISVEMDARNNQWEK